ncbi:MAG TPA: hypothetical protein VMM13_10540 [Euzebya sp.]|nr:hypothetical protein [Euzebya sp.]
MGFWQVVGLGVPLLLVGLVVYYAVKAAMRNAARDVTDEVIVRLMDYGWRPGDRLPPEAVEIRRLDAQSRDR